MTRWEKSNCHGGCINDVLIVDDKDLLLTASSDNSISLWRLSFYGKLYTVNKAHEDEVKTLVYHVPTETVLSAGLDKTVHFWTLDQQQRTGAIFSGVPAIEEDAELLVDQSEPLNRSAPNVSSLTELQPRRLVRAEDPEIKYILKKEDTVETDRVIEMQISPGNADECFMLLANNKSIDRMNVSTQRVTPSYIRENEDIMTFCMNESGSLLITSIIGAFPCFHLWMIDHRNYIGENPFKMFSNRKFYWKTSESTRQG